MYIVIKPSEVKEFLVQSRSSSKNNPDAILKFRYVDRENVEKTCKEFAGGKMVQLLDYSGKFPHIK